MSKMKHILNCSTHKLKIPDIVQSDGPYLIDNSGNKYLDLESGEWCTALGHNNKEIADVIKNQVDSLMHIGFCYSSSIVDNSAKAVLDTLSFRDGKCIFLSSGSEAVEVCRQISRHLSGSKTTLTLHDSYLGAYSSLIDRANDWYLFNWKECETCTENSDCNVNCPLLQNIPETISEFIFEPGSSSGFVKFPPQKLIQNIAQKVQQNGGKIIVNEVTTGIGRTGKWYGFNHYEITPDMVAIGKGLGNGFPVSAVAINSATVNQLDSSPFYYGQSHQNDPLGAAVAKAVIDQINELHLIKKAEINGEIFLTLLTSLIDNEIILSVRGRGLMFYIEITNEKYCDMLCDDLISNGFIVGNRGAAIRLDPPLNLTENHFTDFLDSFQMSINKIKAML